MSNKAKEYIIYTMLGLICVILNIILLIQHYSLFDLSMIALSMLITIYGVNGIMKIATPNWRWWASLLFLSVALVIILFTVLGTVVIMPWKDRGIVFGIIFMAALSALHIFEEIEYLRKELELSNYPY